MPIPVGGLDLKNYCPLYLKSCLFANCQNCNLNEKKIATERRREANSREF